MNVFDRQHWKEVPLDRIPSAPGMLGAEELQFLYFAAREFYSGSGEIVDAGAFLGASTLALAAGLRDNPTAGHKSKRIFSYDFFAFADFYRSYLPDDRLERGDDTLPRFHEFTRDFRDQITAIKGNICLQSWPRRDIEILFVDFTQHRGPGGVRQSVGGVVHGVQEPPVLRRYGLRLAEQTNAWGVFRLP